MKVLIISHNPISTYHNMGKTMRAFFEAFEKQELCQLYIYVSVPNVDTCQSYFRITDKSVLRSYYQLHVKGEEIFPDANVHEEFSSESDEQVYRNPKNKTPFRLLARDLMWKYSGWYSKELRIWLERERPDQIFVAPGTAKFVYDIALKISKKLGIPIVTYVCDDYYFVKKRDTVLGRLQQKLLHKKIEKLFAHTSHIITICDELRECYFKKFHVPVTTVMTGSNYPIQQNFSVSASPKTITYMGNIRYNRYRSLAEIGRVLDEINRETHSNYRLDIYSRESDSEILSHFDGILSVRFCGFVGGADFDRVFRSSEILLHTESFQPRNIDSVKHSVSTKIADSLGSGIPLLAYGPDCIASMGHLIRHQCAFVATSSDQLKKTILDVFSDAEKRELIVKNALATAHQFHDAQKVSQTLYEVLQNIK